MIKDLHARRSWEKGRRGNKPFVWRAVILIMLVFMISATMVFAQPPAGKVMGTVVDAATGENLIGANVYFEGMTLGAATDLDGTFIILNVPVGKYTMIVQMIGYRKMTLTDLEVKAGEATRLDISMKSEAFTTEEVVVEARLMLNNEASLLRARQKALAVSDAISAEAISQSGSQNAAEAMSKVTGASVVGGKYVYIRGLGERYSATMLNGAELPSADPDRKAVQMDLFPSNLLENIVTIKTFTPDKPGNFSGGMVDVGTKNYPEQLTIKFSISTSYNSEATFNSQVLSYPGGSKDWLAVDDGRRAIPDILKNRNIDIPNYIEARRNPEKAQLLDQYSKAFNTNMEPTERSVPLNQSYGFSIGNQTRLLGIKVGYLGSLSYTRKSSAYQNGQVGRWRLFGNVDSTETLTSEYLWSDAKGTDDVQIGCLMTLSLKPHPHHEFISNVIVSRNGESESRYISGHFPRDLAENQVYETRALKYVQRSLFSFQEQGEHYLGGLLNTQVKWLYSYSDTEQNEPDFRFFTDHYTLSESNGRVDTSYSIGLNLYPGPSRYFRTLNEKSHSFKLDFSIPFATWKHLNGSFKFGGAYNGKDRTFRERIFRYSSVLAKYTGDPNKFFGEDMGIISLDTTRNIYKFGNVINDVTEPRGNYNGNQKIGAGFVMAEMPITRKFRFVGGVRFQTTQMNVLSQDTTQDKGKIKENDWLPSFNLIYEIIPNMNLRLAYGKTLARPTLREMAPYVSQDFVNDYFFIGNPNLKRTLIHNYDIRWEWFTRPGEILALSGFYKSFSNPIERVILTDNGSVQFNNVDKAKVFGLEFELRKNLGFLTRHLSAFQLGSNVTMVRSKVDIPESEMIAIRVLDPNAGDSRSLQGQSPFIVNTDISYHSPRHGTVAGLHYNVYGRRLSSVSFGAAPNVFEMPQHFLNFTFSQKLWRGLSFKIAARNILGSECKEVQSFNGKDYVVRKYYLGRTFSMGITYSL